MALSLLSGCDLGTRDDQASHGRPLHVIASYPLDGQGIGVGAAGAAGAGDCAECAVPINAPLKLRFDRFLFPLNLEVGLRLYSADPTRDAVALISDYDPVERVVTFSHPDLMPNVLYTAQVVSSSTFGIGLWAFDGAALEPGPVPLTFRFITGSSTVPLPPAPSPLTCAQVVPEVFAHPKTDAAGQSVRNCTDTGCHSELDENHPGAMGMRLDSPYGVFYTAIGRVAHEADTGEVAGSPLRTPLRFGTGMPIIEPKSPGNSYLLYKLLRKPENYESPPGVDGCLHTEHPELALPAGSCSYPSQDELVALREWFSRGEPMPRDDEQPARHRKLDRFELDELTSWISQGALCDER